jgi:hypothetical protein
MIVVLGRPGLRQAGGADRLTGLAALAAAYAAARGSRVELVGTVGDDHAGDQATVLLGEAGVGHAALLRDPAGVTPVVGSGAAAAGRAGSAPRLEAADVELGLRYLPECRVLVLAEPLGADAMVAALAGAAYHGALVVAIVPDAGSPPPGLSDDATVLAHPDAEDDAALDAFARLVGAYAAALDAGTPAARAFESARASVGWEPAGTG